MTEGTGHVIDPDGDARRALLEAVAEHGPEALSDATIMDNLCRNQLAALPGESILIVSAVMTLLPGDVLLTGTPAGVGPLTDGDEVSVMIESIGTLTNRVVIGD